MKAYVPVGDARTLARDFPITSRLPGWYFRVTEISAGAYRAEGIDTAGRRVAAENTDPDRAVDLCVAMASGMTRA
jgi:hypothetical protein